MTSLTPLPWMAWNDMVGNLSYLILAASFFVTSIYWLRIWAAVAMALEIVYFCSTSWDLYTGVAWDVVFIAINLYRLAELTARSRGLRRLRGLETLKSAFAGLDHGQIAMIVASGQWTRFDPGGRLVIEGRRGHRLHLICAGTARIDRRDQTVGSHGAQDIVGASGFLTGSAANCTVVAETLVRALSFEPDVLKALCRRDAAVAAAIYRLIGCNLSRHLDFAFAGEEIRPPAGALPAAGAMSNDAGHFAV